ncbi:hypothetical protein D3C83_249380 [compost metagenome]
MPVHPPELALALGDLDELIGSDVFETLRLACRRPEDLQNIDRFRFAKTDLLP